MTELINRSIPNGRLYHLGRIMGFSTGFLSFFSFAFLILSFQGKVPAGFEYWHFASGGLALSFVVLAIRRSYDARL